MISYLKGKVVTKKNRSVVLELHQLGLEIFVPNDLLVSTHEGDELELYTHLHVREDILALYGFSEPGTLELFEHLISVSGVGPKTALEIISGVKPNAIKEAIRKAHPEVFSAVSGIGKKTAGKIVLELQSKIGQEEELDFRDQPQDEDVLQALISLGYRKNEVTKILTQIDRDLPPEARLKEALKHLSP